ncbi:MAG: internal scaffolding protein [Microviridae sp.]|nr:MAG: internal scaffolding protein [Microviridae sp.]
MDKRVEVPFVRSPYNYDVMAASDESGLRCSDASLAVQDARDEVDINTIVRRFGLTGQLPDDVRLPEYGDFSGISDYQSALHAVMQADEAFYKLPADIRARFHNSPEAFVDFAANEANRDELKRMGLLKPEPEPVVPIKVEVIGSPPVTGSGGG